MQAASLIARLRISDNCIDHEDIAHRQTQPWQHNAAFQGLVNSEIAIPQERLVHLDNLLAWMDHPDYLHTDGEVFTKFIHELFDIVVWTDDLDSQVRDDIPGIVPMRFWFAFWPAL